MRITGQILFFLSLAILSRCSNKRADPDSAALDGRLLTTPTISGEWEDNSVFMYSAKLTFYKDGTFDFHDRGCTGSCYTKGSWIMDSKLISLTSYDEYDQTKRERLPSYMPIEEKPSKLDPNKRVAISIDTLGFHRDLKFNFDSIPVYFQNRKYLLVNDTLLAIGATSKFVRK